jgi:hypothetical protein
MPRSRLTVLTKNTRDARPGAVLQRIDDAAEEWVCATPRTTPFVRRSAIRDPSTLDCAGRCAGPDEADRLVLNEARSIVKDRE